MRLPALIAELAKSLPGDAHQRLAAMTSDDPRRAPFTAAAVAARDSAWLAVAYAPLLARCADSLRGVPPDEAAAATIAALVEAVATLADGPPLNGDAPGRLRFALLNALRPYWRLEFRWATTVRLVDPPPQEDHSHAQEDAAAAALLRDLVRRVLGDDQRAALLSSYAWDQLGDFVDTVYPGVSTADRRRICSRLRRARSRAIAELRAAVR